MRKPMNNLPTDIQIAIAKYDAAHGAYLDATASTDAEIVSHQSRIIAAKIDLIHVLTKELL
jgi:hypothetical protein